MPLREIHFPPRHEALRGDVHALGALIGEVLREQGGHELFELVEQDRMVAIRRREGDAEAALDLAVRTQERPPKQARDLVRAFSMWFQGVNVAEKVHRIRRRRAYFLEDGARPQPNGIEDALLALRAEGASLEDVLSLLGTLRIEPVFTSHPTESTRRTILRMQQRVATLLLDRLDPTLAPAEVRSIWGRVLTELTTAWQTEDHPRERLTVADEREHVLFYLVEVLYRVLPVLYEEVAQALEKLYGVAAEEIEVPVLLRLGTWVGGDMDGNPDVHAKTIRETLARQQQVIVNAYFSECQALAQKLSQSASRIGVLPALAQRIEQYMTLVPGARGITPARHDRMPYRVLLGQICERLRCTYEGRPSGYESPAQLQRDVQLIADSLRANRGLHAGHHAVRRLQRRIATFGFHLATLDVRQHAEIHHQVIAQGFDDAEWIRRPSAERRELLARALEGDAGPRGELDALGRRTLAVFEAMIQARHRYGHGAVGYYVVSGAGGADDVLAPLLLARWAEAYDKQSGEVALDIAPLFDSVSTLDRAGEVMQELLSDPVYRRHLDAHGRRQCVLVGYSDSNKEAGLCASRFATFRAQRSLASALHSADEQHVIFHGRGGSIARGGGRVDALVRSAPPEAVNGILRFTEQGEALNQSYGLRPIALRTLERGFNALALSTHAARRSAVQREPESHFECGATVARASREAYRALVYGEADFYPYFRAVTPVDVIERMQIGSRPAIRPGGQELAALRAVPWVFAWTQTRCLLPGWYGAGAGFRAAIESQGLEAVRDAYASWHFFRALVDDVEAMLARADLDIAQHYESLAPPDSRRFFGRMRAELSAAREAVLRIKSCETLLDGDRTLQRAILLRNPYVDPMNFMQVDLLRRWRATDRTDRDLFEALLASITGISQGLQSTG
jgi:phosphoenolpyruvate carboxylase